MIIRRELIIKSGSLFIISGCTQNLYQNHTYQEKISEILISADGKNIVFLGKDFHYIIDAPNTIFELIKSTISDAEFNLALSLGFKVLMGKIMRAQLEMTGKRYSSNNISSQTTQNYKLNKDHIINITAEPSRLENILKAPLTPITLAADGVLTLSYIILMPFAILIIANSQK
jgi:hypothetical protein